MSKLHIDIETRSECDLKKCGVYVYAEHPSTEILCICWAVDDGPVKTWKMGEPPPEFPDDAVWGAHNISFEKTVLCGPAGRKIGVHAPADLARWDCTAARAAAVGLPRALGAAAAALDLHVQKDTEGARLMMQMCKPRKPRKGEDGGAPVWIFDEHKLSRLAQYCAVDVLVERELDYVLPELSPVERRAWELTERMNDRGVAVDVPLLLKTAQLIEDATLRINATISARTGGAVPKISNHAALTRWLTAQEIDDEPVKSVGKAAVAAMLENPDIDPLVREVLALRRDGGGSSSSKYRSILHRLSADGRIRGVLVYCGAASTGRWSSRGAQLHNLPRGGSVEDLEGAIAAILEGRPLKFIDLMFGPPLVVASELLRPLFIAGA